jgi:hypothetical protein
VGLPELSQIWCNTIGGRVLWDAPVYEQFFRNVRKVNEELPRERRIRVRHPGELFIFYPLPFGYDQGVEAAVEKALRPWPRPSAAHLTGSWLGAQPVADRALARGSTFQDQVDAVIWFGPATTLTASRPSPELYRSGAYAAQLRRRSELLSEYFDEPLDYIEEGLRIANAGPRLSDGR